MAKQLRALRAGMVEALAKRIALAIERGQLPANSDARGLAVFFATVLKRMSAQARDGATRAELEKVVQTALRAWPPGRGGR